MDTLHPRQPRSRPRRMGGTPIPLIGVLLLPGLWIAWNGWQPGVDPGFASVPLLAPALLPGPALVSSDAAEIRLISSTSSARVEEPSPAENAAPAVPGELKRQKVIGQWEDDYQGHRLLTVRNDGTATMSVEPSGIGKKLFADRLEFEIEWTFTNGRIVMITTGGEPRSKTKLIMNLYGTRAEYTLLNLDDRQLVLLDADGKTKYEWRRIADAPQDDTDERGASAP